MSTNRTPASRPATYRKFLVSTVTALALLAAPAAQAFTPDPDCKPRLKPLPEVRDCGAVIDEFLKWRNKYETALEQVDGWSTAANNTADGMLEDAVEAINPIPTDAQGFGECLVGICKKALGSAITIGKLAIASTDFPKGMEQVNQANAAKERADEANRQMTAWEKKSDDCLAAQKRDVADYNKVKAENDNAKPKYPPNHPKCSKAAYDAEQERIRQAEEEMGKKNVDDSGKRPKKGDHGQQEEQRGND